MDPGYLASLHRSNVDMIDISKDTIDCITPKGLSLVSGKEYEFDVLIMATGFVVGIGESGAQITGRDGKTLAQQWRSQGGAQACECPSFCFSVSCVRPRLIGGQTWE